MKRFFTGCMSHKRFFLAGVLVLCIGWSVLLRLPYINVPILIVDEALYGEIANVILDGGLPYRDAWEQKPPGIYYLYAAVFALFGRNNLVAVHWVAAGAVALTCVALFLCVTVLSSSFIGLISAFFYATLASAGQAAHFQAANTEIFSVMFGAWALVLFIRCRYKFFAVFCAGMLIAISFFFKQPGGLLLPVCILYRLFKPEQPLSYKIRSILLLTAGFAGIVLAVAVYFLYHHALHDLFFVGFWHNILYMKDNDLRYGLFVARHNMLLFTGANAVFHLPALLMFLYCIGRIISDIRSHVRISRRLLFYALWYPFSWFGVSLGWRFEGHYFFFVLPAVAVLSAEWWARSIIVFSRKPAHIRYAGGVLAFVFLIGFVVSMVIHFEWPWWSNKQYYVTMDPVLRDRNFIYRISSYIEKHTSPDDKIFVWGFCPEIYTMSDRRAASRFIFCNFLIGQMTGDKYYYMGIERLDRIIPGAWADLMKDLHETFPKFIIDTAPSDYFKYGPYPAKRFKLFKIFLEKYYIYRGRIHHTDIYELDETKVPRR